MKKSSRDALFQKFSRDTKFQKFQKLKQIRMKKRRMTMKLNSK